MNLKNFLAVGLLATLFSPLSLTAQQGPPPRPDSDSSDSSTSGSGTSSQPGSGGPTGLREALSACAAEVSKDANGRPNMNEMDACMKAKGFTKPSGPPPGGGGPQDPSGSNSNSDSRQ
jgi:hypothetical protein